MVGCIDSNVDNNKNIDISVDFSANEKNEQVWSNFSNFRVNERHMEAVINVKVGEDKDNPQAVQEHNKVVRP